MDTDPNYRNQSTILCFLLLYYLVVLFQIIVQLFFCMFFFDVVKVQVGHQSDSWSPILHCDMLSDCILWLSRNTECILPCLSWCMSWWFPWTLHCPSHWSSNSMDESLFRSFYREVTPTASNLCHHLSIEVFALHFTLNNFIYMSLLLCNSR